MLMKGYKALVVLFTVFALISCNKEGTEGGDKVRVSFSAGLRTKASSVPGVNTLDLLVFRAGGSLEVHGRESGSEITASVVVGSPMKWYLVANAPAGSFDGVADEGSFLSGLSRLADNTSSQFVMAASGSRVFAAGDVVTAELTRLACKVTLGSVSAPFLSSSYAGSDVRVTGLYLINAVGSCPYGMTPAQGDWYNRMGVDAGLPSDVKGLLVKDLDMPLTAAGVDGSWSLYCMPNPVANGVHSGTAPEWSPRNTRLVLEISLDGRKSWFPMDMPSMECNHEYIVNDVRLLGEGSGHQDIPVSRNGITFDVSVNEWIPESKDILFN